MQLRKWLPDDNWVRLAIVPALAFIAMMVDRDYLLDFWHHMARGREIVTTGQLLNHDIFTCTVAGTSFRDVNWLTQVSYYLLYCAGGLSFVKVLNALTVALTFLLLVLFCRQRTGSMVLAAVVGMFTFFGCWEILTIRPQTISMLLFVLVYWALDRSAERPWTLWVVPLCLALWCNVHGAFPAGLILVASYVGGGVLKKGPRPFFALFVLVCGLATFINPYGPMVYQFVLQTSGRATAREIGEWLPPSLDSLAGWFGLVSLVLAVGLPVLVWVRRGRRPEVRDILLLVCFGVLAGRSVRMLVWWLLVAAPIFATWLQLLLVREERGIVPKKSVAAGVMFGVIVLAALFTFPGLDRVNPLLRVSAEASPRTTAGLDRVHRHLQQHSGAGRVFTRFEWATYLTWTAPEYRVFMDSRIDMYPDSVWDEYTHITSGGDNWQTLLDRYDIDYLILDGDYHQRNGLLSRVRHSPQWRKIYQVHDTMYVYGRASNIALLRASR